MLALSVAHFNKELTFATSRKEELRIYLCYVLNGLTESNFTRKASEFFLTNADIIKKMEYRFIAEDGRFSAIREIVIERILLMEPTIDDLCWAVRFRNKNAWEELKARFKSATHKKNYYELFFSPISGRQEEARQYEQECPHECQLQQAIHRISGSIFYPDWAQAEAEELMNSLG